MSDEEKNKIETIKAFVEKNAEEGLRVFVAGGARSGNDEIYVEEEGDKFVFDTGVELKIGSNTYYKQTIISEEEFKNILGQDGLIELYTKDGEIIGEINSKTEIFFNILLFIATLLIRALKSNFTERRNGGGRQANHRLVRCPG